MNFKSNFVTASSKNKNKINTVTPSPNKMKIKEEGEEECWDAYKENKNLRSVLIISIRSFNISRCDASHPQGTPM